MQLMLSGVSVVSCCFQVLQCLTCVSRKMLLCAGQSPEPSRKGGEARPRCDAMTEYIVHMPVPFVSLTFNSALLAVLARITVHHLHLVFDWFMGLTPAVQNVGMTSTLRGFARVCLADWML